MAKEIFKGLIWLGEHRISAQTAEINMGGEAPQVDTTNCESGDWDESILGPFKSMFDASGFAEFADTPPTVDASAEAAQFSDLTGRTDLPAALVRDLAPEAGTDARLIVGQHVTAMMGGKRGEAYPFKVKLATGELMRGNVLEFLEAPVTTHESAAYEFGAIADTELLVCFVSIQKTDPDAAGTLDLVIESDADGLFGSPTTRFTVPQASGAAFYFSTLAGPITDDNFRVNATQADEDDFSYVVILAKVTAS